MILPNCTIKLTEEQIRQLQPLFDAGQEFPNKTWAIIGQPLRDPGNVQFIIVREIAMKGIRALAIADRRERGEIL